jgi:predicted TIM-barrel fold metal-dependent hydrolase
MDVNVRVFSNAIRAPEVGVEPVIELMDSASVERAVIISAGGMPILGSDALVSAENNFVSGEVEGYPDRLVGFCGVNPLRLSAPGEITRCLGQPGMVGVSVDLALSGVNLSNAQHVESLTRVFDRIAELDAPVLLNASSPTTGAPIDSASFGQLVTIVRAHSDVRVTLAKCGDPSMASLDKWLNAANDPLVGLDTANLYLDISGCVDYYKDAPVSEKQALVWRLREWGMDRVFFGSGYVAIDEDTATPASALMALSDYPFQQVEVDTITANTAEAWLTGVVQ